MGRVFEAVDHRHRATQCVVVPAQRTAALRQIGHRQAQAAFGQRTRAVGQRLRQPQREQQVQAQRLGPCIAPGTAQQFERLRRAGAEAALRFGKGQRRPAHLGDLCPGAFGFVVASAEGRHALGQRRMPGEPALGSVEQQREVVVVHGPRLHMSRIALAMIDFWISLAPA